MRKYLIGIKRGFSPAGNQGTLITNYKAKCKLVEVANRFKIAYNHDEVYLIDNYTQKMCEMGIQEFTEYVRKNGEKLA